MAAKKLQSPFRYAMLQKVSNIAFTHLKAFIKLTTKKLINSTKYSLAGLSYAIKCDLSFQYELLFIIIALPLAYFIGDNAVERALLIGSLFIVLICELINSAIESTIDRFQNDYNEFFKRAKDLGSAAVFLAFINVAVIWVIIIFT